jgi:hypothetical protein
VQILVELAELQDQEVGDGTTSVVIVAAELLKRANELVRAKIHPTSIIAGYRLAMRQACKHIEEALAIPTSSLGADALLAAAKTAMSSKIVGADPDFFARIVVEAVSAVRSEDEGTGRVRYPVSAINILKAHGKSARESRLLDGYALNLGRAAQVRLCLRGGGWLEAGAGCCLPRVGQAVAAPWAATPFGPRALPPTLLLHWRQQLVSEEDALHAWPPSRTPAPPSLQGMPKSVKGARIACLDMNLQKARMLFGVQASGRLAPAQRPRWARAGLAAVQQPALPAAPYWLAARRCHPACRPYRTCTAGAGDGPQGAGADPAAGAGHHAGAHPEDHRRGCGTRGRGGRARARSARRHGLAGCVGGWVGGGGGGRCAACAAYRGCDNLVSALRAAAPALLCPQLLQAPTWC